MLCGGSTSPDPLPPALTDSAAFWEACCSRLGLAFAVFCGFSALALGAVVLGAGVGVVPWVAVRAPLAPVAVVPAPALVVPVALAVAGALAFLLEPQPPATTARPTIRQVEKRSIFGTA